MAGIAKRKRAGRRSKLTSEVITTVASYIRGGSYAWVAAAAAGISNTTYHRYFNTGAQDDADDNDTPYRKFWVEVNRAHFEARAAAEVAVHRDNPLAWLRYGPGRERPGEPGWTETAPVVNVQAIQQNQVVLADGISVEALRAAEEAYLNALAGESGVPDSGVPAVRRLPLSNGAVDGREHPAGYLEGPAGGDVDRDNGGSPKRRRREP